MKRAIILVAAVMIALMPLGQVKGETMNDGSFLDELIGWGKTALIFLSRIDLGLHIGQTDEEFAEERMREFLTALQHHDAAAVRSMFAEKSILEADDFDGMVEKAMGYIEGEIQEIEISVPHMSGSIEGGRKYQILDIRGRIITDKNTYRLYAEYRRQNYTDEDADLIGFSYIYLISEEKKLGPDERYTIPFWWVTPGIHLDENNPDLLLVYTFTEEFFNACLHGETAAVESMFTPAVQKECDALSESIKEASGFFEGEFVTLQEVDHTPYFDKDDPGEKHWNRPLLRSLHWRARIITTTTSYYIIVNYSRRSDGDAERTGLWSVLLADCELPHESVYYSTIDEKAQPGLHIVHDMADLP